MALERPTKLHALIHLLALSIDNSLIATNAAIEQSKIADLVDDLAAKAALAGDNVFTGENTFNQSVLLPAATLGGHAVNLTQLNSALSGVSSAIHPPVANVAAARDIPTSEFSPMELIHIASTGGVWRWDASSTATDDGVGVLKLDDNTDDDPGRLIFFLDQAIDLVHLTGNQTIDGVKTFTSSPIVPNATTSTQVAAYGQVTSLTDDLQTEVDAIEAAVGLDTDGTHIASGGNYTNAATTIAGEIAALDSQLFTTVGNLSTEVTNRTNADTALQNELDAVETSVGLNANGTYTAPSGTNYIDAATSVRNEIVLLDAEISSVNERIDDTESAIAAEQTARMSADTALQTELDAVETSVGLNANGTLPAFAGNYTTGSTSVIDAIDDLDSQLFTTVGNLSTEVTNRTNADTALQNELDAVETSVGLNANGTYTAPSGTEYIDAATSVRNEIVLLDAAIAAIASAGGLKQEYVRYFDSVAISTASFAKDGGAPAIPDDDSVQLFVNGRKWRKGADRQFVVEAGGGTITVWPLEEVSDVELRYWA